MSKYADKLMQYYDDNPDFIVPISRKNEMVNNFLKPGLQDLCVSRTSFKWGIPVTFDDKHVVYVWLDALTNYITGIGFDCEGNSTEQYKNLWPANVHIIGKDIVRFHCIYWPIFLMALNQPMPKQIFGHPWLLQDGGKMSKSKGNVIYADDLVKFFGVDSVRYFLLSQMPFDNDGVISWDIVVDTINSELANVYGNLANRTVAMTNKYFDGIVENTNVCEPVDDELKKIVVECKQKVVSKIENYHIADALNEIFKIFRRANKYIDETMPWVLAKDENNHARLKTVLYNLTETIIIGSSLLECFMPESTNKIVASCGSKMRSYDDWDKFGLLENGTKVASQTEIIFKRLDSKEILKNVEELYASRKKENKNIAKEDNIIKLKEISIDDFAKIELRVGEIIQAEKVKKAKKLLKFEVQIGEEVRTIVSGIAKYYNAEDMIGKQVVVVFNLKPAKLCGIESQGMLLCVCDKNDDGSENIVLVSPEKKVSSGSQVR